MLPTSDIKQQQERDTEQKYLLGNMIECAVKLNSRDGEMSYYEV